MDDEAMKQAVAAGEAYEALHVPSLFEQWPPRLLDTISVAEGDRVLDVACGTGVLAREVARRVGPEGGVVGLDPAPGMLAVARKLRPDIQWHEGVAEALPFPDDSFDVVVSQFGLMFFPDRDAALGEMRRVLKPDGQVVVAVWASLEESDAYPEEVELLRQMAGEAAADALRAPFVLGSVDELRGLFERAAFQSVDVGLTKGKARFPSVRAMVEADLRGWLPIMGVHLDDELIESILEEAERALKHYVTADGAAEFDSPAYLVSARKA